MITYNDIYEAARKERYSEQLQSLPKNFIQEVSEYFKEKKEISSKEDDLFSDVIIKTKKQFENAVTIFKELMLRRRKKLLNFVFIASETGISKRDFENMLPFEKDLFEKIMNSVDSAEKNLNEMLEGKKEVEIKNLLLVFNEDVAEFMGFDGNKVGPFSKGQVANLPKEIASILLGDGKVVLAED
jgi:DNA replication initiation complex subunit (GINS family)